MMSMFVGSQRGGGGGSGSALPVSALPAPTDPAVRLQVAGGELIAVAKFEGYITPTAAEAVRQRLMAALERGACVRACVCPRCSRCGSAATHAHSRMPAQTESSCRTRPQPASSVWGR